MNIVITNPQKAEQFGMLFQHVKAFTDHINIVFGKDRMFIQCMDTSHVSIMELYLPSTWFCKYEHEFDDAITIGVSSSMLYKILNSREKTQLVEISYSQEENDKLFVRMRNPGGTPVNKTDFEKHFEIPLMDIDSDTMDIPAIEHQAEITISSYHFASIINQLKMFGDTMDIQCSEEKILLGSNSHENGKMFVEIKIDDLSSFIIDEGKELSLAFSLTYLHNICLYNKIAKEVEVKFSSDYPMQMTYYLDALPEGQEERPENSAKLSFYLAPKIADE
jgi:proliferating cell nuclear antigen